MKRISAIFVTLLAAVAVMASNENVLIENLDDVYRIVPTKDGKGIKEIKNTTRIDYRARRTAGKAYATAFYNDRISIDKASGGETVYGMAEDDDIFYSDSKVCRITLPLKKEGDKATARFERTFKDPKYFTRTALAEPYDVEHYTVTFIIPASLADRIKIVDRMMPADAKRTVTNGAKETTVTYDIRNLLSDDATSRRVPRSLTMPTIYMLGEFSDHNDLYRYLLSLVNMKHDPDSMKVVELAREITRGCPTDSAKIAAIYDYVHDNIRYIAVEHGIYSHMPDLPSEVLRKRYGDCKGSAGLIRALLRGAGLDGRFVWIGTKSIPTDWTEYPLLCSGNHMIAAAMTGDSILYLDGTATYTPLGQMPTFIRGRQTLVEGDNNQCIVGRVPAEQVETDSYDIRLDMQVTSSTAVAGSYREVMRGRFNSALLGSVDATIESKRGDHVEEYLISQIKGSRAENVVLDRSRRGSVITADVTIPNAVNTLGDEMYININPYFTTSSLSIDTKNRPDADAQVGNPFAASYTTSCEIPEGYRVETLPAAAEITNRWFTANYDCKISGDGKSAVMQLTLMLNDSFVPAADIASYVADVRKLQRLATSQLHLIKN